MEPKLKLVCSWCHLPMQEVRRKGVLIDQCANGHVFFDRAELAATDPRGEVFEESLQAQALDLPPGRRSCPRCRSKTRTLQRDGMRAECCIDCGGIALNEAMLNGREVQALAAASSGAAVLGQSVGTAPSIDPTVGLFEALLELLVTWWD